MKYFQLHSYNYKKLATVTWCIEMCGTHFFMQQLDDNKDVAFPSLTHETYRECSHLDGLLHPTFRNGGNSLSVRGL